MIEFRMPSLGADMTEGTVLHWFVHPGDQVKRGDIVAEVDTTKAAIEIECFDDGIVEQIRVPEGRTVPVGEVLATIGDGVSRAPDRTQRAPTETTAEPASPESPLIAAESGSQAPAASSAELEHTHPPQRMTPLIRRLAEQAGLDADALHGTGPEGRVLRSDIDSAVRRHDAAQQEDGKVRHGPSPAASTGSSSARHTRASGLARRLADTSGLDLSAAVGSGPGGAVRAGDLPSAPPRAGVEKSAEATSVDTAIETPESVGPGRDVAAMRSMIASAMVRSKQTVPHYYLSDTIDVSAAVTWLLRRNATASVESRILLPAVLFRAIASAARQVPQLNGHWLHDGLQPASAVHLGVVVSLRGGGIIVPTIADADGLDLPAMMSALRSVVARARAGRLRSSDTTAATITVTSLGDMGVDSVYGVIAVPQVAIVGVGAVRERPCAVDGLLGVRPQLTATLSADHRASDGATGARFLHVIADLVQHPQEL